MSMTANELTEHMRRFTGSDEFHLEYIWREAKRLYEMKNADYGNSLYDGYDLIGPQVTVGRLYEKATRMANAVGRQGLENPEETLLENAMDMFLMSAMLIFKLNEEELLKGEK